MSTPLDPDDYKFQSALTVVRPGIAVAGYLFGAVCVWERGKSDPVAYRKPKSGLRPGQAAVDAIAVAGEQIVVREGSTGFLVLDARTLSLRARLPHKGSERAVSGNGVVVTTGGKLVQAFRPGTWERIALREKLRTPTEGLKWAEAARAVFFRDETGSAGLLSAETLATVASRTFATVPLRYGAEIDPTGNYVAVEVGDAAGCARVKLWSRVSGELVTIDGIVDRPFFVDHSLVVANSATGTATEPSRWISFISLVPGELGRKIREIDTGSLGLTGAGIWYQPVRDDTLVVVGTGTVVVCDLMGALRARLHVDGTVTHVAVDGAELVVATDDGRVTWHLLDP